LEHLEALPDFGTSPLFSELEPFAPPRGADDGASPGRRPLVEALRGHLSPEALVQLTLSMAAANFANRFNEALGTELDVASREPPESHGRRLAWPADSKPPHGAARGHRARIRRAVTVRTVDESATVA
jgi:hypothetical protein